MHIRASHPAARQMPSGDAGYARHIGRIGALAVALGVGAAVATSLGAGTARADDSDSTSASNASESAASTSDRTRRTGADSAKRPADKPRVATGSTGERITRESKVTSTTSRAATRASASLGKPRSTVISVRTVSAPKRATADRAPQPLATASVTSDARSTLDPAPSTLDADAVSTPELSSAATSVEVAEAVAAPSPSTASGDTAPVESPALWALLAWTRRAATENIQTDGAVATSTVTTSENTEILETEVLENTVIEDIGVTETTEAPGVTIGEGNTTAVGEIITVGGATGAENTETTVGSIGTLLPGQQITVELVPDANGEYRVDLRNIALPVLGLTVPFDIVVPPSHGTATLSADSMLTYQPDPKYTGPDTFVVGYYSILGLIHSEIVFEVSVTSLNEVPHAWDQSHFILAGMPLTGDLLQHGGGGDGPLRVDLVSAPGFGSVSVDTNGAFVYTPQTGFSGHDSFTFSLTDIDGDHATATVHILVHAIAPVAGDDIVTVTAGDAVEIAVLDNDHYSGNEPQIQLLDAPTRGVVGYNDITRTFTYTADAGQPEGSDTFTYQITDIYGIPGTGTVTILIQAKPPVAADDTATVTAGDKVVIDVLKNDQHSGGELKIELTGKPAYGKVEYDATTRTFTYIAGPNQTQDSDTFSYQITDGNGHTSTATVTILVQGKPPVAADDTATVTAGDKVVIDVLKNDQHSGGELKIELTGKPAYGKVEYDATTRTFTYIAGPNQTQDSDTFSYQITDGNGHTSTATVKVSILVKPTGPTANDDWATTPNTSPVIIPILVNDDAPGEKPPTVRIETTPRSGKVELLDGTLRYTPDPGFVGTVTIGYSITDPRGITSHATVTVLVTGKESAEHHFTANQGSTLHVPGIQGLLSDPRHQGWTASMAQHPGNGKVELNEDGTFSYTPEPGFFGEDTFVVYVSDGKTETKVNVYITVTETPAEPEPEPEPQPVVQPVGFTSSALALGGGRTTAECTDYWWPEIVDPDTEWPTCTLLYIRDDVNQVR